VIGRRHRDERGVIAVMFAILLVVMLGIVALVVDLGNARQLRREAQASADAAALAGGEAIESAPSVQTSGTIPWSTVVSQIKTYAEANDNVPSDAWRGCSDPGSLAYHPDSFHGNNCISATSSSFPAPSASSVGDNVNYLRVTLPPSTVKSYFAKAVGNGDLTVGATATVKVVFTVTANQTLSAGGPCALCILNGTGKTLNGQNGDVTITGGDVIVNSTSSPAAELKKNGNVKITTPNGHISGQGSCPDTGQCNNFSGSGFSPAWSFHPKIDDPLVDVPQCGNGARGEGSTKPPSTNLCPTNPGSNGTSSGAKLWPGIYSEISGSHHLNPGIYVITCGSGAKNNCDGITLSGNDLIEGDGVMLYFACPEYPLPCTTGEAGAGVKTTGNGALRITGITQSQVDATPSLQEYLGMMTFADRANTAVQTWRGNGTNENGSASGISGTIYMLSGTMDLRGNGFQMASQIVTGFFTMEGNPSTVTIAYDLSKNYAETHVGDTTYTGTPDNNGLAS
jgi:Flp pilus assembly protein TadG